MSADTPTDDPLESSLAAFGRTLAATTGEPIRPTGDLPDHDAVTSTRRWTWLAAAAALVVAVAGLAWMAGWSGADEDDGIADGPPPSADGAATLPPLTTLPLPSTTAAEVPIEGLAPIGEIVDDDPLGLAADGWTTTDRVEQPWNLDGDLPACPAFDTLRRYVGAPTVVVTQIDPATGVDLDVNVLSLPTDADAAAASAAFGAVRDCGLPGAATDVGAANEDTTVSGFTTGEFAIVAGQGGGNVVVAVEIEGAPFDDQLVADLAIRAARFVGAHPWAQVGVVEPTGVGEPGAAPMTTAATTTTMPS